MNPTTSKPTIDIEEYKLIRERWDKEDELLMSRTGIFLTTNSILYAALGLQAQNRLLQLVVASIGFILSFLWLTTSLHSFHVIRTLFLLSKDKMPYGLDAIFKIKPVFVRPNTVFCKLVPGLIIISWIALVAWVGISFLIAP